MVGRCLVPIGNKSLVQEKVSLSPPLLFFFVPDLHTINSSKVPNHDVELVAIDFIGNRCC